MIEAHDCDKELGGDAIDKVLVDRWIAMIEKNNGKQLSWQMYNIVIQELKDSCRAAKQQL